MESLPRVSARADGTLLAPEVRLFCAACCTAMCSPHPVLLVRIFFLEERHAQVLWWPRPLPRYSIRHPCSRSDPLYSDIYPKIQILSLVVKQQSYKSDPLLCDINPLSVGSSFLTGFRAMGFHEVPMRLCTKNTAANACTVEELREYGLRSAAVPGVAHKAR